MYNELWHIGKQGRIQHKRIDIRQTLPHLYYLRSSICQNNMEVIIEMQYDVGRMGGLGVSLMVKYHQLLFVQTRFMPLHMDRSKGYPIDVPSASAITTARSLG